MRKVSGVPGGPADAISRSTSPVPIALGNLRSCRGGRTLWAGSCPVIPSRNANRCSPRTAETALAAELVTKAG